MIYKITFFKILFLLFLLYWTSCTPSIPEALKEKQKLHLSNSWQELPNYPQKTGRSDDLSFVSPEKGWVVNSQGVLHKTEDGGDNWQLQFEKPGSFFRCLVFKDSLHGWLGTLGMDDKYLSSNDSIILYETQDGGENWQATEIIGPYPKGLCGMQKVNDSVMVACGRVRGPSYFLKTTDGGKTWISKNLDDKAGSLVAAHFFDKNKGILIGGTTRDKVECRSLVLATEDGGESWDTLYISQQKGEYLWKIAFPSRQIGYISVQRNTRKGRFYFLKTTDGGKTWQEKIYTEEPYAIAQGIGFIDEKTGWIGGSFRYSYETRDGGETWNAVASGKAINNFQVLENGTAFMTGRGVYKLSHLQPLQKGQQLTYFDNGKVETSKTYKNGMLNGSQKTWFSNGNLQSTGKYKNNLQIGNWKFYTSNGKLDKKLKFKHGVARISNDILKQYEGVYKVREGVYRVIIYQDGQLYYKRTTANFYAPLYPILDNQFFFEKDFNTQMAFLKNAIGEVTHSLLYQPGGELREERIFGEKAKKILEEERKGLGVDY